MPVKTGIQKIRAVLKSLDPGFRRGDNFFTNSSDLLSG
jgi:hypothetical protein